MKFKGKIRFGHLQNSQGPEYDRCIITIEDESSGVEVIEILGKLEDIGKAILTHREVNCEFEFESQNLDVCGKVREHKKVEVPLHDTASYRYSNQEKWRKRCEKALKPFEIDGWKGRLADFDNGRNHTSTGCWVSFTRYVDRIGERT
jgi:hypothetical protein